MQSTFNTWQLLQSLHVGIDQELRRVGYYRKLSSLLDPLLSRQDHVYSLVVEDEKRLLHVGLDLLKGALEILPLRNDPLHGGLRDTVPPA